MRIHETLKYMNVGLPEDIQKAKLYGDFATALRLIERRLADPATPEALRYSLIIQKEIIRRTPAEYPYTKAQALAMAQELVPDFTEDELNEKMDARGIRWAYIDGQVHIIDGFIDTLLKVDKDFSARAKKSLPGVESLINVEAAEDPLMRCVRIMKEKGHMACRIRIRASIKLQDKYFTPGMFMRTHLPLPAACDQQSDIVIEEVFPENAMIDPEDSPNRAICWEENMEENHEFYVVYSYVHKAVYHDVEHMIPDAEQPTFYTEEQAPHIMFTPYIRHLTETLSEGLTSPIDKARAFYDFITKNMKYTFMPPYFLIEGTITENCAKSFTGDCGVFALLFITLCRCAGIPARWQSGQAPDPESNGSHDWVQFYVAPYGWLYADPSFGVGSMRLGNEERRKFYFGNLEPYRMVANHAFQMEFRVPKDHWRNDPYDNQRGEMETTDRGFTEQEYETAQEILLHEEV